MGKIEMNLEKLMNFNINHKHKNILKLKTLDRMIVIVTMQHPFLVKMTHPHANMPEKCPRGGSEKSQNLLCICCLTPVTQAVVSAIQQRICATVVLPVEERKRPVFFR